MTFDLVHQVKARTRSIHLDKGVLSLAAMVTPAEPVTTRRKATRRTSSLPLGQENVNPCEGELQSPATIRHYRSMLDVEDPPKLSPWKPMCFDELYSSPIQDITNSGQLDGAKGSNTLSSPKSISTRSQQLADSTSQKLPRASATVLE